MKKPFLIIGRVWKFLEFMTPTIESVYEHHNREDFDFIILENKSSRSRAIQSYLRQMIRGGQIDGAVFADNNYWSYIFNSVELFTHRLREYENIVFTDMDVDVYGHSNWLFDLKNVLDNHKQVGAISIDVEEAAPYSDGFVFAKNLPEHPTIPGFYQWPIDLGFYMVRTEEYCDSMVLPGSHGFNDYQQSRNKILGKLNIIGKHYGWLRSTPEYREAYSETGILFGGDISTDNGSYYGQQCTHRSTTTDNFKLEGPFFTGE